MKTGKIFSVGKTISEYVLITNTLKLFIHITPLIQFLGYLNSSHPLHDSKSAGYGKFTDYDTFYDYESMNEDK